MGKCIINKGNVIQNNNYKNKELKILMGLKIGCKVKFSYDNRIIVLSNKNDVKYMDDYIMVRNKDNYLEPYFYERINNLKLY